ncbi:hypothetical protein MIMGU_mgv1a010026mg [Erythranthe guttata]|uniref:DUF7036 domain-containing protein n=1 Tax=Erythranthe guttata TaxID=4155 RepID=A0A022PZ96_ERYGU|nr:hypothetical protein MIMGU_mgv1a010026mg [Erythranthe guttata]
MGKAEDGQSLPSTAFEAGGTTPPNAGSCNRCCLSCIRLKKLVNFRCVFALLLGVAVFLSAVFWLPFFHFGNREDLDLDYAGLHLAPYENLYIKLTNLKGSTVAPPTTIQAQVLLAVGINPSKSRLKQLAQTITGSDTKNLGLNNTVFGRVKQVRLSSILQHSLGAGPTPSPSPSPSPSASPTSKFHHHDRQHHHHLSPSASPSPPVGVRSPASAPVPAPAPVKNKEAGPTACPWKYKHPRTAPVYAPHSSSSPPKQKDHITLAPKISPFHAKSPSRRAPPKVEFHARSPDSMPLISPYHSQSSAGRFASHMWALPLFILLGMHF